MQTLDRIPTHLFDDEGNSYPAWIEIEFDSMGDVTVVSVACSANVPLNNPEDEINDAIRGKYGRVTISYSIL